MKRVIFILPLLTILFWNCQNGNNQPETNIEKEGVNILYFHGEHHCKVCEAIETNTQIVVDSLFSDAVKEEKLFFHIIDFSKPENEKIADKYQIAWDALLIVTQKGENSTTRNLTDFAITQAPNNPEKFQNRLIDIISEELR